MVQSKITDPLHEVRDLMASTMSNISCPPKYQNGNPVAFHAHKALSAGVPLHEIPSVVQLFKPPLKSPCPG